MKYVIDTNIIFSCLMSGKTFYIDLLSQNECYSPDFIFNEIQKYEERILKKSSSKGDFRDLVRDIFSNLVVIPKLGISRDNWKKAMELCKEIDEKDTAFVALAIELDIPLLTRDKKLYHGLIEKKFGNIVLWETLLDTLNLKK